MSRPFTPLPDTDDPYLLLDVRPGASADHIRRAYLRRVKMYKPDRHPAEFRRVREAYDRLREQEAWFRAWSEQEGAGTDASAESKSEAPSDDIDRASQASDRPPPPEAGRADSSTEEPTGEEPSASEPTPTDRDGPWSSEASPPPNDQAGEVWRSAQLTRLTHRVHTALGNEAWGEATAELLDPESAALSTVPGFGPLVVEVSCAVVWKEPARFEALTDRYGDLISAHDMTHREGALLHRRTLDEEREAWHAAVSSWPELDRFVALGASLRPPTEAELGLHLGKRAADDPSGFLQVLNAATTAAPNTVLMYIGMAERWTTQFGEPWPQAPAFEPPSVEQAAQALVQALRRDRRVRWEQLRPLLVMLAIAGLVFLPSVFSELLVIGAVLVAWAWNAVASEPAERIYEDVVQPAAARWLWATEVSVEHLAHALTAGLPSTRSWAAFVHPANLTEYPEMLSNDLALFAFAATGPMVPRLRPQRRDRE